MAIQKSEVLLKLPSPNYSQFFTRKKESPILRFYHWVLDEMGQPHESKKFSLNVSSVVISPKDSKKFQEKLTKWIMKTNSHYSKSYAEKALGWTWLDIGPAQFYDGLPEWAEEGHVYVLKDWKKPPTVHQHGNNKATINGQDATQKEVEALKKKYGDELRIF